MHKSLATPINAILNPAPRRQVFEDMVRGYGTNPKSRSTLLDKAAIKSTSEPCKPSDFITVDKACAHPEAKHSVHHGQAGPINVVEVKGMVFYIPNDAAVVDPKAVCSNALEPSAAPEAVSIAAALGPDPPCAAACPAVMTPKSYAAVAKASVVTAAPAQPAAVPKLSVAASMSSADLKPSTATSQLAANSVPNSVRNESVPKVVANVIDTVSKSKQAAA